MVTVLMLTILWVLEVIRNQKATPFLDFFLRYHCLSHFFSNLGFHRLIKFIKSVDHLVNSSMVILHITAYSFILIASIENFTIKTLHTYEESTSDLVINLACTVILAIIVNEICQKAFLNKTPYAFFLPLAAISQMPAP